MTLKDFQSGQMRRTVAQVYAEKRNNARQWWSNMLTNIGLFVAGCLTVLAVSYLVSSAAEAQLTAMEYRHIAPSPAVLQKALDIMDANDRAFDLMLSVGGMWYVDDVAVTCHRVAVDVR